ncbi:hypothetical protein Sango_2977900 [Sesamum angolense]|uniref:Uncharacterized protein n=1 Tax=Sesamum angolense TaxID=2727404 RepID=A0AAE1T497_9LAMI|nr:hypothetical protein Sango_2977900 [Sesamum angolense]
MSARITQKESRSYVEVVQHSEWREAMRHEIQALENNCTWKLAPLPVSLEKARSTSGTYLAQIKYTLDVINDTGLLNAKALSTPFQKEVKLSTDYGAKLQQSDANRWLAGHLLYRGYIWHDIFHFVQQVSQYLSHPCEAHWLAAIHVKHLKGCPSRGIFLPAFNFFNSKLSVTLNGSHVWTLDTL